MALGGNRALARLAAAATAVAMVAAGGCGGTDDDGGGSEARAGNAGSEAAGEARRDKKEQVTARYERFIKALYDGDAELACDMLTTSARFQLTGGEPCVETVRSKLDPSTLSKPRPRVVNVRVFGDEAIVRARSGESEADSIPLAKVRGRWAIDSGF